MFVKLVTERQTDRQTDRQMLCRGNNVICNTALIFTSHKCRAGF